MKKLDLSRNFRRFSLVVIFLLTLILSFMISFLPKVIKQVKVNENVKKSNYPEISRKEPVFQVDIKTADSMTHVISYLPEKILPREKFHEDAARKVISYVEGLAQNDQNYTFNPNYEGGSENNVKLALKRPNAENFVFFISPEDGVPKELVDKRNRYSLLNSSIAESRTFFFTQFKDKGSMTIIRFSESDTWKYGLPLANGKGIGATEKLNVGFNIEIWKRVVAIVPVDKAKYLPIYNSKVFDTSESLWNTFGQLVVAKQEGVSIELMQQRLNNRLLNRKRNRAYYLFDQKSKEIYVNAPTSPIIK